MSDCLKVWCCDAWHDRLCVDRTCTICETLVSAVVHPTVTLGPLTPATTPWFTCRSLSLRWARTLSTYVVPLQPPTYHSHSPDFSPKHPCYCYRDVPSLRTSDCWSSQFKMTSLTSLTPEPAVSHSQVLPVRSGRQMFGNSKEVDWAIGGAALGFTVAIVEYIANNVFDR